MKKLLAAAAAAVATVACCPAFASPTLWLRAETAAYDCLDYASQNNCHRAEQAAKTFQAHLEAAGNKCALDVMGLSALVRTVPLLGADISRPQVMGQMDHVRKACKL